MFKNKVWIAAAAAVLILAAALAGTALAAPAPADASSRTVSVSGNAQVALTPDVAFLNFGVQSRAADAAAAREANSKAMQKVQDALKAKGVDTEDVKTVNFSINPVYDQNGKKVVEYDMNHTVQVKVRALDKLGEVMDAAVSAGANMAGNLWFDVEDREAAYNLAIVKAIENAKSRALALADSSGTSLGPLVRVSESGGYTPWYPPIYYGREYDRAGVVPVSPGSLTVSAAVSVTFELK